MPGFMGGYQGFRYDPKDPFDKGPGMGFM
jgi:hypothetical protein